MAKTNSAIEKTVGEIPAKAGREAKYPFAELTPGTNYLVITEATFAPNASISRARKAHPEYDYVVRREEKGFRVYCTVAVKKDAPKAAPSKGKSKS
jgi:hypothetical protein